VPPSCCMWRSRSRLTARCAFDPRCCNPWGHFILSLCYAQLRSCSGVKTDTETLATDEEPIPPWRHHVRCDCSHMKGACTNWLIWIHLAHLERRNATKPAAHRYANFRGRRSFDVHACVHKRTMWTSAKGLVTVSEGTWSASETLPLRSSTIG